MGDVYEMQIAFDPASAISPEDTQVCGLRVPTRDEIWNAILASPGAVWSGVQNIYANLPDVDFSGSFEWLISWFVETETATFE